MGGRWDGGVVQAKDAGNTRSFYKEWKSSPIVHDPVNHPKHYTSDPSGVECIDITRHRNFNIGNAFKYLWRAGLKDGNSDVQDLRKAIFYIEDEIKRLEKNG